MRKNSINTTRSTFNNLGWKQKWFSENSSLNKIRSVIYSVWVSATWEKAYLKRGLVSCSPRNQILNRNTQDCFLNLYQPIAFTERAAVDQTTKDATWVHFRRVCVARWKRKTSHPDSNIKSKWYDVSSGRYMISCTHGICRSHSFWSTRHMRSKPAHDHLWAIASCRSSNAVCLYLPTRLRVT